MFGELLESRARRQRRTGGVVLSVVTHVTIIGAVTVVTARGAPAPKTREKAVIVHFRPPPPSRPVERPVTARVVSRPQEFHGPQVNVTTVVAPTVVPPSLPPIDLTRGLSADSIVVGATQSQGRSGLPSRTLDLTRDDGDGGAWRGADLLMRITASAKPRYPENLRMAGIDGRVLVRFAVDTVGRIDPASVEIVSSTHELFTNAVRQVLGSFRFKPAESGGHRVRALAEMPFEFSISSKR
jgi:protein TonB